VVAEADTRSSSSDDTQPQSAPQPTEPQSKRASEESRLPCILWWSTLRSVLSRLGIHPFRKSMQFSRGGPQSIRSIAPDLRHNFIIDVSHDVSQVCLQMRCSIPQLLFPRPFRHIIWHKYTSAH
jgi:hypothetical protein